MPLLPSAVHHLLNDVLLWHLAKKKGLSAYGYADDLALASKRVWRL